MAFRLSTKSQNNMVGSFASAIDGGSGNATGQMLIYSGTQPTDPQTAPPSGSTLLVTIPFNNPSFGSPSGGTVNMVTAPQVQATIATGGTAGWFRIQDRSSNAICDGAITATGGGGDVTLSTTALVQNGTIIIQSLSFTEPM